MYLWYICKGYILAFSILGIFKNQLFINSFNNFNNFFKKFFSKWEIIETSKIPRDNNPDKKIIYIYISYWERYTKINFTENSFIFMK